MEEPIPKSSEQISDADWAKTPVSVRQLIEALGKRVEQLEQELEKLQGENQLLQEQGKRNSQNSSIPPSQEQRKGFKPKPKTKSGKQRGGQPGHEGHDRPLYPSIWCESVTGHDPAACWNCGQELTGSDPQGKRILSIRRNFACLLRFFSIISGLLRRKFLHIA